MEKIVKCPLPPYKKKLTVFKKEEGDDLPVHVNTAVENGYDLEKIIYEKSLKLPNLVHSLRENDIKKYFNDTSLNGIDHWIQVNNQHFFIQDKWKESLNQQEVSQFLNCVSRIQLRLEDSSVFLLWVSKRVPTPNCLKMLRERKVHLVISDESLDVLAKNVIMKIFELINF
jgi:hypothetical protein